MHDCSGGDMQGPCPYCRADDSDGLDSKHSHSEHLLVASPLALDHLRLISFYRVHCIAHF